MTLRLVVTRVQPQAAHWVKALTGHGHGAVALPLIDVGPTPDTTALRDAWRRWNGFSAVMFVSSHAVDFFCAAKAGTDGAASVAGTTTPRLWCTGPGTRSALLRQGFAAQSIDSPPKEGGQFDSEALWRQVEKDLNPGARVLIVRGDTSDGADGGSAGVPAAVAPDSAKAGVGREWLAQRLRAAAASVEFVVAYQRAVPVWSAEQMAQARAAATDASVWLFSSAEALQNLRVMLPGQIWTKARALCTHARIGEAARQLGFVDVVVSQPTLEAVLASLESLA